MKENLQKDLGREPTEGELAEAMNMTVVQVRKRMEVGRASRNKLIKVVFFYFPLLWLSRIAAKSFIELGWHSEVENCPLIFI